MAALYKESDVIAERFGDSESVNLSPFGHQVGGHFAMMIFDKKHLAKPLIPRENFFYLTKRKALAPFLPAYQGVISMSFTEGEDHVVQCIAKRKKVTYSTNALDLVSQERHGLRLAMNGKETPENGSKESDESDQHASPWAKKCLYQLKDLLVTKEDKLAEYDYIVLENVVARFKNPSILDLKLGTQSHCDVMTEAKKKIHMDRCAATTSSSLGIRFSGMQLFNSITKGYTYRDKFYGRDLTAPGLEEAIKGFLCGGNPENRKAMLTFLLDKVEALKACLEAQDSVRLFSVSLLLIYEGSTDIFSLTCPIEVRMIDFANATHSGYADDPHKYSGPDEGFLLGLGTLHRVVLQALQDCTG